MKPEPCWAGVDVGGKRKGFHLAVLSAVNRKVSLVQCRSVHDAVTFLKAREPRVVAIDSPIGCARPGQPWRWGERRFRVCGIRFTPDERAVSASAYYAWISHGLELYNALRAAPFARAWKLIECFPTAFWTRCLGPRGNRSRADWSCAGVSQLQLSQVPARMNQDARDSIAAAQTAWLYDMHRADAPQVQKIGSIVVPLGPATRPQDSLRVAT